MTKLDYRTQFLSLRAGWSEDRFRQENEAIAENLIYLPELKNAELIMAFLPILSKKEFDFRPLMHIWLGEGKRITIPVMTVTGIMRQAFYDESIRIVEKKWGVLEPEFPEFTDSVPDVCLFPGLGADRSGVRLGYGKGFYDRFFAQLSTLRIFPVHRDCLVENLPREPHDQLVDIIVTGTEVLRTGPRRSLPTVFDTSR